MIPATPGKARGRREPAIRRPRSSRALRSPPCDAPKRPAAATTALAANRDRKFSFSVGECRQPRTQAGLIADPPRAIGWAIGMCHLNAPTLHIPTPTLGKPEPNRRICAKRDGGAGLIGYQRNAVPWPFSSRTSGPYKRPQGLVHRDTTSTSELPHVPSVGMVSGARDLGGDSVRGRDLGERAREGLPGQSVSQRRAAPACAPSTRTSPSRSPGYRPQVNVGASIGVQYLQTRSGSAVATVAGSDRHAARDDGRAPAPLWAGQRPGRGRASERRQGSAPRQARPDGLGTSGSFGSTGGAGQTAVGGAGSVGAASRQRLPPRTITSSRTIADDLSSEQRQPDGLADALQRLPDRQPDPTRRVDRLQPARDPPLHRAHGPLQRRSGVHERAQQHGDAGAEPQQRRGARGAAPADARPLQRRRGHPHRRRPGRGAPRRRPLAGQRRRVRPCAPASASTARTSASSRASWRRAGRWIGSCRRASTRPSPIGLARASADRVGHPRRRCRRSAGEGARGPARPDASACRARSASSTTRTARTRASSSASSAAGSPSRSTRAARPTRRSGRPRRRSARPASRSIRSATRSARRSSISGAGSRPPRRRSSPPRRRSRPTRSRSTACARKRASASAPPSTCSTRSRNCSTRA